TATQTHHAFAGARFARAGVARGENNQPGPIELQGPDFLRRENSVGARSGHFSATPSLESVLRSGEREPAPMHRIVHLQFRRFTRRSTAWGKRGPRRFWQEKTVSGEMQHAWGTNFAQTFFRRRGSEKGLHVAPALLKR